MLIPNHPDDERVSALAAGDADARADAELVAHVDACDRCTELARELDVLRSSLSELPDVAPSRPLRLLPAADEPAPASTDRLGDWVRRLFAPALTAGVALAMVGLVGTTAPALENMAGGAALQAGAPDEAGADRVEEYGAQEGAAGGDGEAQTLSSTDEPTAEDDGSVAMQRDAATSEEAGLPAERSPWPMLLFSGVALVIGAVLLRWIVVPRAG